MSRPTQELVEDNVLTWQCAVYELHREIDKLDQELDICRHALAQAAFYRDALARIVVKFSDPNATGDSDDMLYILDVAEKALKV